MTIWSAAAAFPSMLLAAFFVVAAVGAVVNAVLDAVDAVEVAKVLPADAPELNNGEPVAELGLPEAGLPTLKQYAPTWPPDGPA